jgi:solute carrier family 25 2-oxodicarboxylate transporter 21
MLARPPSAEKDTSLADIVSKADIKDDCKPLSRRVKLVRAIGPILASAFCVAAIMYPLDLVRALQMENAGSAVKLSTLQLLNNFKEVHGIKGFFVQGLVPELVKSTYMRFVKFSLFPLVHMKLFELSEKQGTAQTKALAAFVSSIPEAISIMPLEIAKVSLQLDRTNRFKNSMLRAMGAVLNEKGLGGFFVGYIGVQYRQSAWTSGYFASIKFFDRSINQAVKKIAGDDFDVQSNKMAKVGTQLLSGFLAGVFGACLNTPGDTIRTTVQKRVLGAAGSKGAATTFLGVGNEIFAARGMSGLYAGLKFKALHLGGSGALMAFFLPMFTKMFSTYE